MRALTLLPNGKSLPFEFDRGGLTIVDWVLTIVVKQIPSDADNAFGVNRIITPTGNVWAGFLTASETGGLSPGLYFLIAKLVNSTTDEAESIRVRFNINTAF